MKKSYNIILVDDHNMFSQGLGTMLREQEDLNVAMVTESGHEALKYLENNPNTVDLVITDIQMPEMDGITLAKAIKKSPQPIRILVISMLMDAEKIKVLTEIGVNGHISKNAGKTELLKAIYAILKGENYFSSAIKQTLTDAIFKTKQKSEVQLTVREEEVLKLIAQEFTTQEIADHLFLSKHTIESYRKNLISKLGVRNLAGLTREAIERGLLKETP